MSQIDYEWAVGVLEAHALAVSQRRIDHLCLLRHLFPGAGESWYLAELRVQEVQARLEDASVDRLTTDGSVGNLGGRIVGGW